MDSPSLDSIFGSIGAPNPILLEEEQIILSQPCLFLQDMMGEANKNNVSVEEGGGNIDDSVAVAPTNSKTKKGARVPKQAKQKAPLMAMEGDKKIMKAAHVAGSNKSLPLDSKKDKKKIGKEKTIDDYKKRAEMAEAAVEDLKKAIANYQKRIEKVEAALEEWENNIGISTIKEYQARAEKAEKALEELKKSNKQAEVATTSALDAFKHEIGAILIAGDDELKKQCREKNIRIFGGAAMKHKYACALLKSRIEE